MRIAICEDNAVQAEMLRGYVEKWGEENHKPVEISCFQSAEEFLFYWPCDAQFEVAFLDIELGQVDGMDLARTIRKQDRNMVLIFTTGLKGYVFRGYEVKAYRYMLKPLKAEDVYNVMAKATAEIEAMHTDAVVVPTDKNSVRVFKRDIYYIQMDNHYVVLHTVDGDLRYRLKMDEAEILFHEPDFCKCHRSYIINMYHTKRIDKNMVTVDNGDTLSVSRSRWNPLNECFMRYYSPEGRK